MININANIASGSYSGGGAPASSLLDGLIHVWPLDEEGTTTSDLRLDSVGSSHLTPAATLVTPVQGKNSFCYKNTNSDDPYLYTDDAALRSELTGGSWTISTWVNKTNVFDATFGDTVLSMWGLDSQRCFTIRLQPNNTIALHLSTNGSSTTVLNHSVVMNLGQWYHIAAYFDRETKTAGLSVNGSVPATTVLGDFLFESTASFAIGNITNPNTLGLNGLIDEVYMWNRLLMSEEIAELYNAGAGKFYPFAS